MTNKKFVTILKNFLLVLSIIFIAFYLKRKWPDIKSINWHLNWLLLIISLLFACLSWWFNFKRLASLFKFGRIEIKPYRLVKIISQTNLYRYIPGGIWDHLGIAYLVKNSTKSIKSLSKITQIYLVNVLLNLVTALFFLVFLIPNLYLKAIFLIIFISFNLHINALFKLAAKFLQKFFVNRNFTLPELNQTKFLLVYAYHFFFWLFISLSFLFLVLSLGTLKKVTVLKSLTIISSYPVAWAVGFLALPFPNGALVREATMGYFLNSIHLKTIIGFSVSLIFRLLILVRDLGFFVVVILLFNRLFSKYD